MKKLVILFFALTLMAVPFTVLASEGPMKLPAGSNADANMHNEEGIKHFGMGHFDEALKHFEEAAKADKSIGEVHFNEAVALDKLGRHAEATMHFKAAKKNAGGNENIINSPILNAHIGH